MSQPFVGEIRMVGFSFAPVGWSICQGQVIPISENDTLFNLIGTTYGGDGQQTFQLPDLQGRVPVHQGQLAGGSNYVIGEKAGVESVTLTINQIPVHNHSLIATANAADSNNPNGAMLGNGQPIYSSSANAPNVNMNATILGNAGGSQPHENLQPLLVINFIISLFGIFPTQN